MVSRHEWLQRAEQGLLSVAEAKGEKLLVHNFMLSKKNRISNRQLLKKLFEKGKQYKNNNFIFKFLPSIEPISKFSVVVSKKVASKAVDRNKLRRQIFDCIQNNMSLLKSDIVVIVIAKNNVTESKYEDLNKGIEDFLNQNTLHVQ